MFNTSHSDLFKVSITWAGLTTIHYFINLMESPKDILSVTYKTSLSLTWIVSLSDIFKDTPTNIHYNPTSHYYQESSYLGPSWNYWVLRYPNTLLRWSHGVFDRCSRGFSICYVSGIVTACLYICICLINFCVFVCIFNCTYIFI